MPEMLESDERAYLALYSPSTYGIEIPRDLARRMEKRGLVEWLPPKFGTTLWGITDKGREAIRACPQPTTEGAP